jgi:ComF family protein
MNISTYLRDFIGLHYPVYCPGCGRTLVYSENVLCLHCLYDLPKTNFHTYKDNPVEMTFAGRAPVFRATAFCFFRHESMVQRIIHQFKYNGRKKIGFYLGCLWGRDLLAEEDFRSVDSIIPIPLHPKKQRKRGYNQSEYIAQGIAQSMSKQMDTSSLIRVTDTATQTRKARYSRWENVSEIFRLTDSEQVSGKHILLVDDVITTGATLEAAAQLLLTLPNTKVSIAALGYVSN